MGHLVYAVTDADTGEVHQYRYTIRQAWSTGWFLIWAATEGSVREAIQWFGVKMPNWRKEWK